MDSLQNQNTNKYKNSSHQNLEINIKNLSKSSDNTKNLPLLDNMGKSRNKPNSIDFILPENVQEEGILTSIEAYERSTFKTILYIISVILTLGIMYLVCRWEVKMYIKMQLNKKNNRKHEATHYFTKGIEESAVYIVKPQVKNMTIKNITGQYVCITFRLYVYYYDQDHDIFKPIQFNLQSLTNNEIHEEFGQGIRNQEQYNNQLSLYGKNNTEIPPKSSFTIFVDEILSPFYIFQIFSIILWYCEQYIYYSTVILFTSALSVYVTLVEAKENYENLKKMSYFETKVNVYRGVQDLLKNNHNILQINESINQNKVNISSLDLVPGDIIEIPEHEFMPCDIILLNGSAVMNESMLTGESIPVIKNSLPYNNNSYNPNQDGKQQTLFAGTHCIETRYYMKGTIPVLGIVSQTSFNTMKGELVRSILFPKENSFQFYADAMKYVGVLACLSVVGFLISLKPQIEGVQGGYYGLSDMIMNALDLITVTVPPALPTCLSIGIALALGRMKKKQIYCISPPKVNICGQLTKLCFDKTGTLTEDGLDLYGVRPIVFNQVKQEIEFVNMVEDINILNQQKYLDSPDQKSYKSLCLHIMASCHSLTRVQGELIGDPLEVKMFESTNWVLEESDLSQKYDELVLAVIKPPNSNYQFTDISSFNKISEENNLPQEIGIIKRFEFSSKLQRMSTIVKKLDQNKFTIYVKGAPEKIKELSKPETVPENFQKLLNYYSQKGYRVLGFGFRELDLNYRQIQKSERESLEQELTFAGILVMENKLKGITKEIIMQLHEADVKTVMVTGDNALTAISVGRQCHMIQEHENLYLGDIIDDQNNQFNGDPLVWTDFEAYKEEDQQNQPDLNLSIDSTVQKEKKSQKQSQKIKSCKDLCEDQKNNKLENRVLAVTGVAFQYIVDQHEKFPDLYQPLLHNMLLYTKIYARMKPEQKAHMITLQQELGGEKHHIVGMIGDGANDCAALKSADVGVSLSEAEASIAAPFTSKVQDISCVITVLKEGRAALVTSFQCFKYMALYSMIQFTTVCLLYFILSLPADLQFLYWDLFIIIPLAFLMGMTEAQEILSKKVPGSQLISFTVLSSVIGQTVIQASFQIIVFIWMINQSWYASCPDIHKKILKDLSGNDETMEKCFEPTVLFWISNFQYLITCVAFSIGKPWRKPFYTNYPFTLTLVLLICLTIWIQITRWDYILEMFLYLYKVNEKISMPENVPYWLLLVSLANIFMTMSFEQWILPLLVKCWYSYVNTKESNDQIIDENNDSKQSPQIKKSL